MGKSSYQSEFDHFFTLKYFFFQFANNYTALYYVAFFRRNRLLWGSSDVHDNCQLNYGPPETTFNSYVFGCSTDLALQILALLLINVFVGLAVETILPWALSKFKQWRKGSGSAFDNKNLPWWEVNYSLSAYEGPLEDYNEMVVQYGLTVLFAAALPLAPLISLFNNIVENRTDAIRYIKTTRRPEYRGARNIGVWDGIIKFMSAASIISNCLYLGYTSPQIGNAIQSRVSITIFGLVLLAVVLGIEHFYFVLYYILDSVIPTIPRSVRRLAGKMKMIDIIQQQAKNDKIDWNKIEASNIEYKYVSAGMSNIYGSVEKEKTKQFENES